MASGVDLDLLGRITKLEKEARCWRLAALALLVGFVGWFCMGAAATQPAAKVVRAQSFECVNAQGKVVACLKAGPVGGALSLANKDGAEHVNMFCIEDSGELMLGDFGRMDPLIAMHANKGGAYISVGYHVSSASIALNEDQSQIKVINSQSGREWTSPTPNK